MSNRYYLIVLIISFFFSISSVLSQHATDGNSIARSGEVNEAITFNFSFNNDSEVNQNYHLQIDRQRELICEYKLSNEQVTLSTDEAFQGTLVVKISDRIPAGGYEKSTLLITNDKGQIIDRIQFTAVRSKQHPFLLVTDEILEESRTKINTYDWAKNNLDQMLKGLDSYNFPERKIITKPRPTKVWSSLSYKASDGEKAFQLCLAWRLTEDTTYLNKVVTFIRELTDKEKGYLSVGAATTGVQVHEGNFFLFLAAACDIIFNEPVLSDIDKENITEAFRYYLEHNKEHMSSLGVMNHQASANAGAILVALFLEDIVEAEYLLEAEGGMADQIGKGVMADGWWFESTANYCYLVVQRYILVAQAFENYGWDLYHRRFPTKYKSKDFVNAKEGFTGMKFDNWGSTGQNTRGLEDMVTPYIPMMDENAYVVSSNDSNLKGPDDFYELAYRHYQIDELAWVLGKTERLSWVSLIYGVAELPAIEDPRTESAFAPNVGITALRSQKENRNSDQQIQAYLKYGTHGGWHGHFDRTGLLALDRYGHKYFGTEMAWFGYGNAGYKECVQTSATHNMVVVDGLQQEAVPSEQTLFYGGEMMQVSVLETKARWRKIPTINKEFFPPWNDFEYDSEFQPVLQRRLAIVTDDYVILTDYMNSSQQHDYDWFIHPVGFESIDRVQTKGEQMESLSTAEDSPYKYFKNAQWYSMKKGATVHFDENGMKLDVHTVWPKKADILIANYPSGGKYKQDNIRNNPERRTYGIRTQGQQAVFVNVLEPYKMESAIESIDSSNENELTISLKDGREQIVTIINPKGASGETQVTITERVNGKDLRTETSQ